LSNRYIGLDLGGTNIAAAVVDAAGGVQHRHTRPTEADLGPDRVIDNLVKVSRELLDQAGLDADAIAGVGIGAPGLIDFHAGVIKDATNLPGFQGVPICDRLSEQLNLPVHLDNDANAAALGEFWAGAAKSPDIRNMVMVTLGTGVGGGAVVEGQVVRGSFGMGMEVGHMIVYPNGERFERNSPGALETYASANAVARRATEAVRRGEVSRLGDTLKQRGRLTSLDVYTAATAGDELAARVTAEAAEALGIACVTLARVFDPQRIVFAGGMVRAGETLFAGIRDAFDRHDWGLLKGGAQIVPAQLIDDAGVVGAAALAWQANPDKTET